MIAYERCHSWRELFIIARELDLPDEELTEIGHRVAGLSISVATPALVQLHGPEAIASRKQHLEAAQILLDYCKDVPQAVGVLVHGNEISEALRMVK